MFYSMHSLHGCKLYEYDMEWIGEWSAQNQPSNAFQIPKTLHSPLASNELMFLPDVYTWERASRVWDGWAQTWADPTWAISRITEKLTKMLGYEKDALRGSLEGAMNQIGWFLMFYLPAKTCSKFSYQAKELLNFWYHHRKEWYRILHLTPVTIKFQQKLRKKGVCFPENSLKCEVLNAVFPQSSQRYADGSSHLLQFFALSWWNTFKVDSIQRKIVGVCWVSSIGTNLI